MALKPQRIQLHCVLVLSIFHLFLVKFNNGQFPRRCTNSESITNRECCPIGADGSKCGMLSNRGVCTDTDVFFPSMTLNETFHLLLDDRAWWPSAFYDKACQCKNNFDGVDCSKCKPGYEGDDCSIQSPLKIRKNIMSLSSHELQNFISIVHQSKRVISQEYVILTTGYDRILRGRNPVFANASIYDVFVWMHYYVTKENLLFPHILLQRLQNVSISTQEHKMSLAITLLEENPLLQLSNDVDYAHEGPGFLPWHRYFMMKWETEIREYVAKDLTFALPYWDWRERNSCDVCNNAMFGGQNLQNETLLSDGSPFSAWQSVCTKGNAYSLTGQQCTGQAEGPIFRNPGNFDPFFISGLPTSNETDSIFQLPTEYDTPAYDRNATLSFRNLLEGFADPATGSPDAPMSFIHNAVHLFMNGTMSSVDTSANDPIFIVHHTFVDSLYEMWLKKQQDRNAFTEIFRDRNGPRLGHRPYDYMVPFFPLVKNSDGFLRTKMLGYAYDYMVVIEQENLSGRTQTGSMTVDASSEVDGSAGFNAFDPEDALEYGNLSSRLEPISSSIMTNAKWFDQSIKIFSAKRNQFTRATKNRKSSKRKKYHQHGTHITNLRWNDNILNLFAKQTEIDKEASQENDVPNEGTWDSLKLGFENVNRAFRKMSSDEVAWLVVACVLVTGCAVVCCCACRLRPRLHKQSCCCRCQYDGEEEEYYALLDKNGRFPKHSQKMEA